jgi:hypothetical protein
VEEEEGRRWEKKEEDITCLQPIRFQWLDHQPSVFTN